MIFLSDEGAFPQVVLFTVLIIIILYNYSNNAAITFFVSSGLFVLGINGYLEDIGIGCRSIKKDIS